MFGGLKTGMKVIEPKWIVGEREITNYFDALAREEGDVFSTDTSFKDICIQTVWCEIKNYYDGRFSGKILYSDMAIFRQRVIGL